LGILVPLNPDTLIHSRQQTSDRLFRVVWQALCPTLPKKFSGGYVIRFTRVAA
jgi:hypothetical protein